MDATSVVAVIDALRRAEIDVWLDVGWGIDALLGEEHRPHDDLDLVVALDAISNAVDALASLGYRLVTDLLPTRAVLRDGDGRQIDFHPITFDATGTGWQRNAMPNGEDCEYQADGFTVGRVGEMTVGCLTAQMQLAHHLGYAPRAHDYDDMARLSARFGIDLPPPYSATRTPDPSL